MSRVNVSYTDLELEFLDSDDLIAIELKAKALSLEECLSFLCVDLTEVPDDELILARKAWKRGRVVALNTAAEKMFASMSARGGGAIAMEYLKQLSSTFKVEAVPDNSGGDGFTFNVVMPDGD